MLKRLVFVFFTTVLFSGSALAQSDAEKIDELYEILKLTEVIQVMRDEGVAYGDTLAADLFQSRKTDDWNAIIELIYDTPTMSAQVRSAFHEAMAGKDIDASLDFFKSEPGSTIIDLEISARVALMDETIEAMANDNAAIAMIDETARFQLVNDFVEVNDLIESNIVGALNANFAFMSGLMDGGALPQDFSEDEILLDVWAQEPAIRASTSEWAYSFLLLAFQPLDDDQVQAYIAYSETDAGQDLNDGLFAAFDGMLEGISRDLGLAASRFMTQQEL